MIFGRKCDHLYDAIKYLDLGALLAILLNGVFNKKSKSFWEKAIQIIPIEFKNLYFTGVFEKSNGNSSTIFHNASQSNRDTFNVEHRARLIREILVCCRDNSTSVLASDCKCASNMFLKYLSNIIQLFQMMFAFVNSRIILCLLFQLMETKLKKMLPLLV